MEKKYFLLSIIVIILIVIIIDCQVPASNSNSGNNNNSTDPKPVNQKYPRAFSAWGDIENRDTEDKETRLAHHDLIWVSENGIWQTAEPHPHVGLATQFDSSELQDEMDRLNSIRAKNPRIKILCEIRYFSGYLVASALETDKIWENGYFPDDSPFWLRNGSGDVAPFYGGWYFIDFTNEDVQDIIAEKALALKNSGLVDGIFFDNWREEVHGSSTGNLISAEDEWNARLAILQKVRNKVGNDFLIIVNGMTKQLPNSVPYLNGIYMECVKNHDESYTSVEILDIENILIWNENASLLTPKIICLEGWREIIDINADKAGRVAERDSQENTKMMRLFTTMSMTLSDGYVLFCDPNDIPGPDHRHNWYSFWDINLGKPISPKTQNYNGINGLYIREYEKGWAVYNHSGAIQHIVFPIQVTSVAGGIISNEQDIQDMEGEIYLK